MSPKCFFVQECPICGRPLEIAVEYLGKQVFCDHCGGHFLAHEAELYRNLAIDDDNPVMRRADELLEISTQRLRRRRGSQLPSRMRPG